MNLFFWAVLALLFATVAAAMGFTGLAGPLSLPSKMSFVLFAGAFVVLVVLGVFGFRLTTS